MTPRVCPFCGVPPSPESWSYWADGASCPFPCARLHVGLAAVGVPDWILFQVWPSPGRPVLPQEVVLGMDGVARLCGMGPGSSLLDAWFAGRGLGADGLGRFVRDALVSEVMG